MKRILILLGLLALSASILTDRSVKAQAFLGFHYTRVFSTTLGTATQIKATPGILHTVIQEEFVDGALINFQVLDVATGCQAVPSSDPSIIFDGSLGNNVSLEVDASLLRGLCV